MNFIIKRSSLLWEAQQQRLRLPCLSKELFNYWVYRWQGPNPLQMHSPWRLCGWHSWFFEVDSKLPSIGRGSTRQVWHRKAHDQTVLAGIVVRSPCFSLWTLLTLEWTRDDGIVGETVPEQRSFIRMKDNRSLPVCNSKFILSELHPLEHPPTARTIKRPSPDWNVKNADVTALDKLVVIVLSWIPGRAQKELVGDRGEGGLWKKSVNLIAWRES